MTLALSIKHQLEKRYDEESLKDFYIYEALLKLMAEWEQQIFSCEKSDIGSAGQICFDSDFPGNQQLRSDISKLSRIFRMKRKDDLFPARKGPK